MSDDKTSLKKVVASYLRKHPDFLDNNPDLLMAMARIERARALLEKSAAPFYPQVNVYTEYVQGDAPSAYLFKSIDQRKLPPDTNFNAPGWFENYESGVSAGINLFNGGRLKAMPPKLLSDDGQHVVIRPLAYCSERDIARYADMRQFPLIPCNLCGSQDNLQRQAIKEMLAHWQRHHPGRIENIFRAIANVSPSQLADRELFDFINLGGDVSRAADLPDWLMPDREHPRPLQIV